MLGQGEEVTFVEESGRITLISFGGEEVHVNRVAILKELHITTELGSLVVREVRAFVHKDLKDARLTLDRDFMRYTTAGLLLAAKIRNISKEQLKNMGRKRQSKKTALMKLQDKQEEDRARDVKKIQLKYGKRCKNA